MKKIKEYLKLNNEVLSTYDQTGLIDRDKDELAAKKYFLEEINQSMVFFHNYKEKIDYLIENNYYESEFLAKYDLKFIESIFEQAYAYRFRFPSFMSASKFYGGYALKDRDTGRYLERYEDRHSIVALFLADGNEELARKYLKYNMEAYQPATPTFNNAGKKARGEFVSCYKISASDNMNSVADTIANCLQLSKVAGGVGVNLNNLRPAGDPIKGVMGRAAGVLGVAKIMENSFTYADQEGARPGAGAAWINILHGDVMEFLSAKKENADEKVRLATLSTGLVIPDIFVQKMVNDESVYLFSSYDVEKKYGVSFSNVNLTDVYDELMADDNVRKLQKLDARNLFTEVMKSVVETGYPYVMFEDTVRKANPNNKSGKVTHSNICTEILQNSQDSIIRNRNEESYVGKDVSCNLGSLDVHASTKVEDFAELVEMSVRQLIQVSDITDIKNVQSVARGNKEDRSIGLGAMNVHGHFMYSGIRYGSKESINFVSTYFATLNYFSLKTNCELAKERNENYVGFESSTYADGSYFDMYLTEEFKPEFDVVSKALGNVPVITQEQWAKLKEEVMKYGLISAYRLAIAPTGSISYARSATASLAPITERTEVRDYGNSRTIYVMPFLTNENKDDYIEAYDTDQYEMVDLYAAAQRHIDQGISMTLYIYDDWNTEQLTRLYYYAWTKGIKTVYYVRQRVRMVDGQFIEKTVEECESCSV